MEASLEAQAEFLNEDIEKSEDKLIDLYDEDEENNILDALQELISGDEINDYSDLDNEDSKTLEDDANEILEEKSRCGN